VIYLSVEQFLFLHDRWIEETGGEHGLRDLGGLESALARPRAAFGDTEFYPDIFTKPAILKVARQGRSEAIPFSTGYASRATLHRF
jgi:death-on-curing protein